MLQPCRSPGLIQFFFIRYPLYAGDSLYNLNVAPHRVGWEVWKEVLLCQWEESLQQNFLIDLLLNFVCGLSVDTHVTVASCALSSLSMEECLIRCQGLMTVPYQMVPAIFSYLFLTGALDECLIANSAKSAINGKKIILTKKVN
jgi:hypothetical protein